MPTKQYELESPTAASIVRLIVKTMGEEEGLRAWRTACEASGKGEAQLDNRVENLQAILQQMTNQPGLAELVARSGLIRLHTWRVLKETSKIRSMEKRA